MKVDSINSNVFCNKSGGVKYLRILNKDAKNLRFINATKETSDVGMFIAGGSEIDRKVHEANLKTMMSNHANKQSGIKRNSLWKILGNILNL